MAVPARHDHFSLLYKVLDPTRSIEMSKYRPSYVVPRLKIGCLEETQRLQY